MARFTQSTSAHVYGNACFIQTASTLIYTKTDIEHSVPLHKEAHLNEYIITRTYFSQGTDALGHVYKETAFKQRT